MPPLGLTTAEARRRLGTSGANELPPAPGVGWARLVAEQLAYPLALLLLVAAGLAAATGGVALAVAITVVVVLNAAFAVVEERQAMRSVASLDRLLTARAVVVRDGRDVVVDAREVVPGDLCRLEEGEHVPADAELVEGALQLDMSALTGESAPVVRRAGAVDRSRPAFEREDLVFSGTSCLTGRALAVVRATGERTELGRVAELTRRIRREESPLERQVRHVARLIALVALGAGVLFLPAGLAAGLGWTTAATFSIGLIVANVPEGLLPTITLALAIGVRDLARRHAIVKRLSAVETLGSTTVVCTDKTGTLTGNDMRVVRVWVPDAVTDLEASSAPPRSPAVRALADAACRCTTAETAGDGGAVGDPMELALVRFGAAAGAGVTPAQRDAARRAVFPFDPSRQRMSTVDTDPDGSSWVHVKGAPESVLEVCAGLDGPERTRVGQVVDAFAADGLRVLAVARRRCVDAPAGPAGAERDLELLGVVGLLDPPRPEVAEAIARAHTAGIRVHVLTGDLGATTRAIAGRVGIGSAGSPVVTGAEVARMPDDELRDLLSGPEEVLVARSTPAVKLRVARTLQELGNVVAMTGDGVNDAPALHCADIGVAMGRGGTDVAREAATMVLADDDFATIVGAVETGRRVYDNVRKFIVYIFAHAVPEVAPFLVFALAGGAVPLPLTVLQILAVDLGTDVLPALALSREPAEPGIMRRPPRPRHESVIRPAMLARSWGLLGATSAVLTLGAYFASLLLDGWRWGADTGSGTALHGAATTAGTVLWVGIVACQLGVAVAARTEHASLRSVGLLSNRWLLAAMAAAVGFAAAVVYVPVFQGVFSTAALPPQRLALVAPFPFVVWGVDELARALRRRRTAETAVQ